MKVKSIYRLLVFLILAISLNQAKGQLLLEENFNYTGLLTANGWANHSGTTNYINTTAGSLTYTGYQSSGVGNMAYIDTTGEDINKGFTQVDTGSVYVSCLANVQKATTTGDYFLHISTGPLSTSHFKGRVFVKYDDVTGKIAFGLALHITTGVVPVYTAFDYDLNTTYLLVMRYNFRTTNDIVYLYVNPVINGTEPTATLSHETGNATHDLTHAATVALRQGTGSSAPRLTVDGIRIGQTWTDVLPYTVVSNSGIFESYVTTRIGTDVYDLSTDFDGKDFGDVPSNWTFTLKGGQVKTWKNAPPDDVTAARMFYRIYEQSATPGAFTSVNLPFSANLPNPGDQLWESNTLGLNIVNGLTQGSSYFLEVYFEADYTAGGTPAIHMDNNSGNNYKAEFTVSAPAAQSGIFERYIVTNTGTDIYTEGLTFNGSNLGNFMNTDVLVLKGGQAKTWKLVPPDDITGARMFYRVYLQGGSAPIFTSVNLPWSANLPNLNDQLWENITVNANILNGLAAGNYYLEVYYEADYTTGGTPGIHTDNNGGNNYKASFTVVAQGCAAYPIPFTEGFNAATIPTCWTQIQEGGATINWTFVTTSTNPSTPYEGTHFARLYNASTSPKVVKLVTPPIDLSAATMPFVKFRHYMKAWTTDQDELRVYYRTNLTSPWVLLATYTSDVSAWTERKLFLPNKTATYQIAFEGTTKYGYGVCIDNVVVDIPPAKDFAVVEWVSPKTGCSLAANEHIVIKVANLGSQAQSNVTVVASIDGAQTIIGPEYLPGIIQPGDTITYTFIDTANMAAPGIYYSGAVSLLQNDADHSNDTIKSDIYGLPNITAFPYMQDFDAYAGWSPGIINGTQQWELGLPGQTQLNSDYSGINGKVWMTKLTANYDNNANVYLMSPCLNFNNLSLPMLSVYINMKSEANYDAMVLESSVDGGTTWVKVAGDAGFYNNTSASGSVAPPKWSGTNGGWTKYETSMPDLAGEPNVKLRFRFQSDGTGNNEGFAIDEIRIYEPISNDVGATAVIAPVNSFCGSATDTLKVVVQNYGFQNQDTIQVKIKVVKPDASVLNFTDTLFTDIDFNEKDTLVSFPINTQLSGVYFVTAYTNQGSDLDHTNDTVLYSFTVTNPLSVPYAQNFNGTVTGWDHNMTVGTSHGSTTAILYKNMWSSAKTAYARSPKLGLISTGDFLLFDYRIVDYDSPWPGTVIGAGDTIKILISTDCGATFDCIDTIYDATHVTSNTMVTKQYSLDAYDGDEIIVKFDIQRQTAGDYYVDIDNFIIGSVPDVNLGNDTLICSNATLLLDAENVTPYTIYSWTTLNNTTPFATTQTITVDSAATYVVVVDNGFGMTDRDTIVVGIKPQPVMSLGADKLICTTGSTTLDAGLEITTIFSEGLRGILPTGWTSNNGGGLTIEQTTSGGYLLLDDATDWVVSDAYDLTGLPLVKLYVDIASYGSGAHNLMIIEVSNDNGSTWNAQFPFVTDTTTGSTYITQGPFSVTATGTQVKFRFKRPAATGRGIRVRDFKLTSSAPFAAYNWSTGATTQTINVSNAGNYSCEVTAANGCSNEDTVNVSFFTVTPINFGLDTAICQGDILVLDAGAGFDTLTWNDNTHLQTLNVTGAGTYWVVAEDTNGCTSTDTISVIISPLPVANLGPDTSYCHNGSITLDAGSGINYSYIWKKIGSTNTIGTSQTLVVNTTGTYHVVVDNGCSSTAKDTIVITERPLPIVNLGPDMNLCPQTPAVLDAGVHVAYLWSTGATSQQITITLPGVYKVTVTGSNACQNADTITVGMFSAPTVNIGPDTTICVTDQLLLDAGTNFSAYFWFDSTTTQTLLIDGSVYGAGTYNAFVVVTDNNSCTATDTVVVIIDPCTNVEEWYSGSIEIYPNPTNGKFVVTFNDKKDKSSQIFIYNIEGQIVTSIINLDNNENNVEFDLSKNAAGTYFIKVISETDVIVKKIILQ